MAEVKNTKQESFWVLLAQSGDKEAFNKLLKAIEKPLYRYVYRLAGEHALAEDILQEVFILIYRKLGWLQEPKLFRAWTYRIASREAFKRLKNEKHWSEQIRDNEVLETIPSQSTDSIDKRELLERLSTLIFKLSPASRAVLILHYQNDLPLTEIAEILGIAVGTVKSRLAYGLEKLRQEIKKE
ncbi:MAG: RNA polymerase sigma factor [Acidobacteria bacterium]|nr:RNA polymerase sigma factor [Acidobacteriota bacterium]MCA1637259.1 RNA polymerase sigma factor [Acidobacteriota bacterium]